MVPSGSESTIIPLFIIQYDTDQAMGSTTRGSRPGGVKILSNVQTSSGAHPASFNGYVEALSPRIKHQGHKAHHTSPVKKEWSCASTPPICLHGIYI
jgi:hypothetical protein